MKHCRSFVRVQARITSTKKIISKSCHDRFPASTNDRAKIGPSLADLGFLGVGVPGLSQVWRPIIGWWLVAKIVVRVLNICIEHKIMEQNKFKCNAQ